MLANKTKYVLIAAFTSLIVFIILYVPFFEQSTALIYFRFVLITLIGAVVYKALKLKARFDIKSTNTKYWTWALILALFTVIGDYFIGGTYIIFSNKASIFLLPVLIAVSEELIARVILLQTFAKGFGYNIGLILQAIVFTLLHFDFRLLGIIYYMTFGIGAGLLMNPKKGNFVYPLVAHYVSDMAILWLRFPLV